VNALTLKIRDPNPILVKELRSTFRTNLFIRFLYLSVGVIGVIVLGGGAMVAAGPLPPAKVGQVVFQIFFSMALLVISLVAPAYASTSITAEREQKTYESLLLSGMPAWRIVRGKFIAAYASMFLVIVALGPVVGIAFLFGGISPGQVVVGFLGILLVLAPAVALGVAVSARVGSTRIAILIATIVFFPTAMFVTTMIGVLGEPAGDEWALAMEGPFWWTEALTEHFLDPRILGLLVALPLYVFLMPVWLFLASAVAGIRPPAEDRSTPFKWWSVVAVLGMIVIVALVPLLTADAKDAAMTSVLFGTVGQSLLLFIALIFMNEPPLPPRLFTQRMKESKLGFIGRAIGPGAAPTLRFATAVILITSFAMAALPSLARHLYWPTWDGGGEADVGLLVLAAGNAAICFFFLSFGVWLRVMLRNGIASRILAIAALMTMAILPFLFAVIIDPNSVENLDESIPFFVQLSPNAPTIVAFDITSGEMEVTGAMYAALPVLMYTAFGGIFWVLVEVRCAKVQRLDDERRAKRDELARTSEPTVPLLTRGSRPSLATAIAARSEEKAKPFPEGAGRKEMEAAAGGGASGSDEWQGSTEAFELTREKEGGAGSETETDAASGTGPGTGTGEPSDFSESDPDAATEVDPREPEPDT
jgi:ABC-type transport system involved in multi-copper enzyme maturation permease subunit